jgi:regulation of enolase protein 1 (concanavalin A-like superfamily)
MPLAYDNRQGPFYSEVQLPLATQDWVAGAAETLHLSFRGHPIEFAERADGGIAMGAGGTDIWGSADEFRFAYKRLNGDATIIARVDSLANSNGWAKAGVMIREGLTAPSQHASVVVTPENGVSFQRRVTAGSDSSDTTEAGLAPPYWVKLERTGDTFTAQRSADGVNWQSITADAADSTITVNMSSAVYVGLAVTSHDTVASTLAEFSNITITGDASGPWQTMAIGAEQPTNAPETLYVAVEDAQGHTAVTVYPAPEATNVIDWQEWAIPLSEFAAAGVDLTAVEMLYIGVGDRDAPQSGGTGTVYIDDIGVGRAALEQ